MKVAICFSGAIRSFDDCVSSTLKYLINNFTNPDIFLHMWTFTNKNDIGSNEDIKYNFKWRKDNSSIEKIIEILKPKKYIIEEYTGQSENMIIEKSQIDMSKFDTKQKRNYGFNCCSMYWKILKSFELAEEYCIANGFEYDLVIRARLDFIWEDHIKLSDFTDLIGNKIFLIKDRYATCSKLVTNDKFFAGNFNSMKKMCCVFNNLKEYQDLEFMIEGQTINETHIKKLGFDVKWIGHAKTYYKFMERHKIIPTNTSINIRLSGLFDSTNNDIMFSNEFVYRLLDCGYKISCSNIPMCNYNKISNRLVELEIPCDFEITNELVSDTNVTIIVERKKISKIIKLVLSINLMQSIQTQCNYYILIDFIQSLLSDFDNIQTEQFNFIDLQQINQIKLTEIVRYKHMDHGYYLCEYTGFENNTHTIMFDKKKIKVSRDSFKIVNLYNYYQDSILPIN